MIKRRLFRGTLRSQIEAQTTRQRPRVLYQPIGELMEPRALQSGLTAGAAFIETIRPSVAAHIIAVVPPAAVNVHNHAIQNEVVAARPVGSVPTTGASISTDGTVADDTGSQPPPSNGDDSTGEGGVVNQDPSGS